MSVAHRYLHAVHVPLGPFLASLLALGPLAHPTRAATPAAEPAPQHEELEEHFRKHRWAETVAGYRRVVTAEPENAKAWFRLGYALHALERYDEALRCHEQAAVLPSRFQVAATYNAACARALRGEVERALEWLERAVDTGFREVDLLDSDPDLNNLRTDPRFKRLRADLVSLDASASALPCPPGHARQFDFLVGRWRARTWTREDDAGWRDAGELLFDTRPVLGGEALVTFAGGTLGDREVAGVLLRRYDADEDVWITVLNWPEDERSSFSAMRGRFRHGRAELFTRFYTGRRGEPTQTRATISDVTPERLRMDTAVTTDGGRTWEPRVIHELERASDVAPLEAAARLVSSSDPAAPAARSWGRDAEYRAFDFLLGEWSGQRVAAACGTSTAVEVRARPVLHGAVVVVETSAADPAVALGSYALLGYEPGRQRWVRYAVETGVSGVTRQEGRSRDEGLALAGKPGPGSGGSGCRLRWPERDADRVVAVCQRRVAGDGTGEDDWVTCWREELRRVR